MPYARDLVDAPGIDEGLLLQAQRVLARAVGAAPEGSPANKKTYADSIPAAALPPSRSVPPPQRPSKSPLTAPEIDAPQTFTPAQSRVPTQKGGTGAVVPAPPGSSQKPISTPEDDSRKVSPAPPERRRPGAADVVLPSARPPPLDLELTPPPMFSGVSASFTLDVPGPTPGPVSKIPETPRSPVIPSRPPESARPIPRTDAPTEPRANKRQNAPTEPQINPRDNVPTEREERVSKKPPRNSKRAPPSHRGGVQETRPPPKFDPRAEPESDRNVAPTSERESEPDPEPEPEPEAE
jgi:hypothetical protein